MLSFNDFFHLKLMFTVTTTSWSFIIAIDNIMKDWHVEQPIDQQTEI